MPQSPDTSRPIPNSSAEHGEPGEHDSHGEPGGKPLIELRSTFWWSYAGSVASSVLMMLIGIASALMIKPGGGIIAALNPILGSTLGRIVLVGFFVVSATSNVLNLYGAVLTAVTAVQTFAERWLPTPAIRAVLATGIRRAPARLWPVK